MRSINTIEWFAGREDMPLNGLLLNNTVLVRLFKYVVQILFYIPVRLDKFLDRLDTNPVNSRQQAIQATREGLRTGRHQNIPPRVWQRRSALLTVLDEKHQAGLEQRIG